MTATRPPWGDSNQGDDDVEHNTASIRQDHDKTKGSNREEDCEYGDEGFESDAGVSAGRGADDRGSAGVDDRVRGDIGGRVEGGRGSSSLAKKTSGDGDIFQIDDDSDEMPAVSSADFVQRDRSEGFDKDSGQQKFGKERGEESNNSTRIECHSPMSLSVDDSGVEQYIQSQPGSGPEGDAVAEGDYSPSPRRRSFRGGDGNDRTGSREDGDDNKNETPANTRPSSDSARHSQENKPLRREGAVSADNTATVGIFSPASVAPEHFEIARGDRCATRGEGSRGGGIERCERRQSQENVGEGRRGSKRSSVDLGPTSNVRRERQERMIQQLGHDNVVLKRKVAGFQLALQLSADEDGFATSPSFSAAFSAAPPAFPRDGGTPAPSPRVTRGWTHESPPARRVSSTIERDLSYTSLVRQLNTGERRTRTLRRANEALGTRVNELESGAILRATQARLTERDEDMVALRGELAVMQRLARAQDRKFEGSSGYALARRLWAAEEELRLARSTISALGVEVVRIRNARKPRRRKIQNRVPGDLQNTDTSAAESQRFSAPRNRRLVARRKPSADTNHHASAGKPQGGGSDGGKGSRRKSARDSLVEQREPAGEGARWVPCDGAGAKVARGGVAVSGGGEEFNNKKAGMEVKAERLQRALENMRSKAKGELRAAHLEIDGLNQEKTALAQALATKAKEVRLQVLQVSRLKRELRDLSAGTAKLEEATFAFGSAANIDANSIATTRAIASATGSAPSMAAGASLLEAERRQVKSAAAAITTSTSGRRGVSVNSLSTVRQRNPRPVGQLDDRTRRVPTRLMSGRDYSPMMRWNQDWDEEGDVAVGIEGRTQPFDKKVGADDNLCVAASGGSNTGQGGSSTGGGDGDGSEDGVHGATKRDVQQEVSRSEVEEAPTTQQKKTASLPIRRASRFPCPLSGVLDMSERPAPHQRRSVYSNNGKATASLPKSGTVQMGPEKPRGDKSVIDCFIDSDGLVRHSKKCVLFGVVEDKPSTERFTQPTGGAGVQAGTDPEPGPLRISTGEAPVCDWSRKDPTTSAANATIAGRATTPLAAALSASSVGPSSRGSVVPPGESPRDSCVFVSGDARLKPTIQTVRRPIQLSVESVPEITV